MEYKDYYQILGVARKATQDEIKRAYRKLARKYHPDVSKESDAETRFKEVGEAYEVLKDPEKRVAYDQLGAQWKEGQDFRPPPDWNTGFEFRGGGATNPGGTDHSAFFEDLFGHAAGPQARSGFHMRGEDHHAKVLIDIEDSFNGATRSISLQVPELTKDGHVISRERTLNVRIPKGIRPGQQIRLQGQGGAGPGGTQSGDLYLEVEFRQHSLYRADGSDIYLDLPVTPWEAALGSKVKVPTPTGSVDLKIPANSSQGRKLRLKGRGLPGKKPGDLYVVLQVSLPPANSDAAKKLYKQMEEQLAFNPRAKLGVS
ncbi:MAG: DnaJ domain-containing protein [Proteobacteria bacterium]|jgi:curved DNA-binding protein|nr:DnaJ domain-containing protein [Pseudomonadota bacterium]